MITEEQHPVHIANMFMTHLMGTDLMQDEEGTSEARRISDNLNAFGWGTEAGADAFGGVSLETLAWLLDKAAGLYDLPKDTAERRGARKFLKTYEEVFADAGGVYERDVAGTILKRRAPKAESAEPATANDSSRSTVREVTEEPLKENAPVSDIFQIVQSVSLDLQGTKYSAQIEDASVLKDLGKDIQAYEDAKKALQEQYSDLMDKLSEAGFKPETSFTAQAVRPAARRSSGGGGTPDGIEPAEVRKWAYANGYNEDRVKPKGRVPLDVVTAYREATGK
ncbi:hypothetical protein ACFYYS_06260 [Streptomyces sp. NPDC002120]|uniref:hypothetical protein n=1 Tax=Streptomyces sp. NPDC002120 TaxID=3364631 RepID=UPI0036B81F7E